MPTFEAPCVECYQPVTYSNGRAASHDCVPSTDDESEND